MQGSSVMLLWYIYSVFIKPLNTILDIVVVVVDR